MAVQIHRVVRVAINVPARPPARAPWVALLLLALGLLLFPVTTATFAQITNFNVSPGNPAGGLVQGLDGNLYGTSFTGGSNNLGTVFKITPAGALSIVASFDGTNGSYPRGTMVADNAGNFYGVAYSGGATNAGTIFKVTTAGQLLALHSFGNDTANPYGGLTVGNDGNFYGTTETYASVFCITPGGSYTNLTSYFGQNGYALEGGLALGPNGIFYGVAATRAFAQPGGLVFSVTTNGIVSQLTQFNVTNGDQPYGGLVLGGDGNFYGTTSGGGASSQGTVFKIGPTGVASVLYSFAGGTADGGGPNAALIQGSDGNFYGTSANGGIDSQGTLFEVTPGGLETVLYYFSGGQDGRIPGGLIQGIDGIFYGTTTSGGSSSMGTVFAF
jgi:uncharacterized repeat protein (TIGR03803 family)